MWITPDVEALAQKIHRVPMMQRTNAAELWTALRALKFAKRESVLALVRRLDDQNPR
jgi:hypothetical protein